VLTSHTPNLVGFSTDRRHRVRGITSFYAGGAESGSTYALATAGEAL